MIVTFVHVFVLEAHISDFIEATIENQKKSVREPGNLRFDILQDAADPAKLVLYEAYESEEASAAHKNTSHYLVWRDKVAGWMAQPRQGIKHTIIYPTEKSQW
ncbi:MAG: antibiotic biosynthesis monooxygenase [Bacteroidales bacterium]|nr:antibiotic biosynthesis monooxygenase [Bacteroidales bacterium]MBN2764248.1 antibiotic biosynthesis monooxygenase [Bacteroidales bacterium]